MPTERLTINADRPDAERVKHVCEALASGAVVAFPTETVYGVAANASLDDSVRRLREIKGRSQDQPFTVHIGRRADYERFVGEASPLARRMAAKGWPGPLTLIFPVADPSAAKVHASLGPEGAAAIYGEQGVGIRMPDHAVAGAILAGADVPIIASSANVAGSQAPIEADQVLAELGGRIDILVDSGRTRYRKGSTIVRLNGQGYELVRAGVFDARTIRRLATVNILLVCAGNTCRSPMAVGILRKLIADARCCAVSELPNRGILVYSAGTFGGGGAASPHAVEVCKARGMDISDHRSRAIDADMVNSADHILTMTRHHRDAVLSLSPRSAGRAAVIDDQADIADPIGGTLRDYERVAEDITQALERWIHEVAL